MRGKDEIKQGDKVMPRNGGNVYRVVQPTFDQQGAVIGYLVTPTRPIFFPADTVRKLGRGGAA